MLLGMNGMLGLHGWQWVFIICGLPAVLLAIPTLAWLPESPAHAKWLRPDEVVWLESEIEKEGAGIEKTSESPLSVLTNPRVLLLAFAYVPIPLAIYGLSLWLPTLIKSFNASDLATGFLSAVPFLFGVVGLLIVPRSSDLRNERFGHIIVCTIMGIVGLAGAALSTSLAAQLAFLCMVGFGLYSASAVLWTLPSRFLVGTGAAAGLAVINSIGNLGGYLGPFGIGLIKEYTGSLAYGLYFLSAGLLLVVVLVLQLRAMDQPTARTSEVRVVS
jgi:sugar phosphate permease